MKIRGSATYLVELPTPPWKSFDWHCYTVRATGGETSRAKQQKSYSKIERPAPYEDRPSKYKRGDNMAPTKNKRVTIFKISNSFSGAYANNESNLHLPTRRSNDNEPHIMTIDDNRLA